MKRVFIFYLVILVFAETVWSQTLSTSIQFEERVYNFGTIQEKNGKVSHTFIFRNNGTKPVSVDEVNSGCGCIGKMVTKGPVKPGEKGKITITFNPSYLSGFFSKEIVVLSNNGQEYSRIWVEGVIEPMEHPIEDEYPYNFGNGLYLRLKVMAFGYAKPGETKQMQLHYANSTSKDMTLKFEVDGNSEGLQFTSPGRIPSKTKGVVNFIYTMPASSGKDAIIKVVPYVNGRKLANTLELKILNEKLRPGGNQPARKT